MVNNYSHIKIRLFKLIISSLLWLRLVHRVSFSLFIMVLLYFHFSQGQLRELGFSRLSGGTYESESIAVSLSGHVTFSPLPIFLNADIL